MSDVEEEYRAMNEELGLENQSKPYLIKELTDCRKKLKKMQQLMGFVEAEALLTVKEQKPMSPSPPQYPPTMTAEEIELAELEASMADGGKKSKKRKSKKRKSKKGKTRRTRHRRR